MTEQLKLKLNDSKATRWGALVIVAFTMMAAYYVNDVVAPLKTMLETDLAWTSSDFGFFTGGYSFLNVFFLMLYPHGGRYGVGVLCYDGIGRSRCHTLRVQRNSGL